MQLGLFWLPSLLTLVLMAFQLVSDVMLCAAGSLLTSFTPTLILLA